MPVYEYACTACGERTEARQGFDDPPLEECPVCRGRLRKLYSPVGIVFKGSGFYSTDARSNSSRTSKEPADKGDKGKGKGKTETKKESPASSSGSGT